MFIGITTSMLGVYFVLLSYGDIWSIYPITGTLGVAALFTTLKFALQNPNIKKKNEVLTTITG